MSHVNPAQFRPRVCMACGGRAHRLEVHGELAQDRLSKHHFLLLNPQQVMVCLKCGNVFDVNAVEPAPEHGGGESGFEPKKIEG